MKRLISFILLQLVILTLNYNFANANSAQVYISEIFWTGSNISTADEWIELYNPLSESVNINGWTLTNLKEIDGSFVEQIMVTLDGEIAPNATFLIANNSPEHSFSNGQSALNSLPNSINSSISLSNSNLQIKLYKSNLLESENLVDIAGDSSDPLAGDNIIKSSMSRKLPVQDGTLASNWYSANYSFGFDDQNHFGTPGYKNVSYPKITSVHCNRELLAINTNNEINCTILAESYEQLPITVTAEINNRVDKISQTTNNWLFSQQILANSSEFPIIFRVSDTNGFSGEKSVLFGTYYLSDKIVISEVYPSPNENEDEWIEIYNQGTQPINLKYWKIDDILDGGTGQYQITNDLFIDPEEYMIFEKSQTGIGLNNSNDEANLIDPQGSITDKIVWNDTQKGQSLARLNERSFVWTSLVTKGSNNIFPPSNYKNTELEISEIMPNPSGSDENNEWIELYNDSDRAVDLSNWSLDDIDGDSSPYIFDDNTIIEPREYIVIHSRMSGIELKNIQDEVRLLSPDGDEIEKISYFAAKEGKSFAKETNKWYWTKIPTPGKANTISLEDITLPSIEKTIDRESDQEQESQIAETTNESANQTESIFIPKVLGVAVENAGLKSEISKLNFKPIIKSIYSTRNNKNSIRNYLIWIMLNGIMFYSLIILIWKKTKLSEILRSFKNTLNLWHPG